MDSALIKKNYRINEKIKRIIDWESSQFNAWNNDIFGFNAIQLGGATINGLENNRIPHKWKAEKSPDWISPSRLLSASTDLPDIYFENCALPFANDSLDLLVLPHPFDFISNSKQVIDEAMRVITPHGSLMLSGFIRGTSPSTLIDTASGFSYKNTPYTMDYWEICHYLKSNEFTINKIAILGFSYMHLAYLSKLTSPNYLFFNRPYCLLCTKQHSNLNWIKGPQWREVTSTQAVTNQA